MSMNCDLELLAEQAKLCLEQVFDYASFKEEKARFLGSNGKLRALFSMLASASKDEKPMLGRRINECKARIEAIFSEKLSQLENSELLSSLGPKVDPSIPVVSRCGMHPLSMMQEIMAKIFRKIGFTVALGPEIETIWYCYDALNVPESHPARGTIDTLYFNDDLRVKNVPQKQGEDYILRSQTSTVQIRTMLTEKPPLRIISPGRTFRRDTTDATHSANFHQCEGLLVDRDIGVVDLKAVLDFFFKELVG
ncbi:MAG: phenylalanine--tRNA ligase subunit alpha, partial [Puniceicoccales bacterium]|nr:phenylalanine--tRNA ligase subunit alpha [Puniceicoccales bacterium]